MDKIAAAALFITAVYVESQLFSSILILLSAVLLLMYVPHYMRPIRYGELYVHECMHGIAALIVDGKWVKFEVYKNYTGMCWSVANPRWPVSMAGYVGVIFVGSTLLVLANFEDIIPFVIFGMLGIIGFSLFKTDDRFTGIIGISIAATLLLMLFLPGTQYTMKLAGAILIVFGAQSLRRLYGYDGHSDAKTLAESWGVSSKTATLVMAFVAGVCVAVSLLVLH